MYKSIFIVTLLVGFLSPKSAGASCEDQSFLTAMKSALDDNSYYTLIDNGAVLERGKVKGLALNERLLAITTHSGRESRATYFFGKESADDESSFVYSMVNHKNKIFNSVSRGGKRQPTACSVQFEISEVDHTMRVELNADSLNPNLMFRLGDDSYIEYRFSESVCNEDLAVSIARQEFKKIFPDVINGIGALTSTYEDKEYIVYISEPASERGGGDPEIVIDADICEVVDVRFSR